MEYPRGRTEPEFIALRARILEYLTREMSDA